MCSLKNTEGFAVWWVQSNTHPLGQVRYLAVGGAVLPALLPREVPREPCHGQHGALGSRTPSSTAVHKEPREHGDDALLLLWGCPRLQGTSQHSSGVPRRLRATRTGASHGQWSHADICDGHVAEGHSHVPVSLYCSSGDRGNKEGLQGTELSTEARASGNKIKKKKNPFPQGSCRVR